MNRREFCQVVVGVSGVGAARFAGRLADTTLEVGVWLSERAARYDGIEARAESHLRRAFAETHRSVAVAVHGPVTVTEEDGYEVFASGEWPSMVLAGYAGRGPVTPAEDVNVLVTDGSIDATPSGAAVPHVASLGGARLLARMPPADATPAIVPYTHPARAVQLLLHECGHALGLLHGHGAVTDGDGAVVATPMVSTYAWAADAVTSGEGGSIESTCGGARPDVWGKPARLGLTYSACARRRLRRLRDRLPTEDRRAAAAVASTAAESDEFVARLRAAPRHCCHPRPRR